MLSGAPGRLLDADGHHSFGLSQSLGALNDVTDNFLQLLDKGIEPVGDIADLVSFTNIKTFGEVCFATGDFLQGRSNAAKRLEYHAVQAHRKGEHEERVEHDNLGEDFDDQVA